MLHALPPNEAVVTIATEIQLAETSGMMNLGIPSSVVKQLRNRLDQHWSSRRGSSADESAKMLARVSDSAVSLDARVEGSSVAFEDLLGLSEGDILALDQGVDRPLTVSLNGVPTFSGQVMVSGRRRAVAIAKKP
jgi:flagellar motor switch protein FliM